MTKIKFPSYGDVESALQSADAVTSPSEAHGLLTGLICVGVVDDITGDSWAESIYPGMAEPALTQEQIDILSRLFEITKAKIDGLEFDFRILLPDDEAGLTKRAEELGYWCRGFLIGLNLGGFSEETIHSEDCVEALRRMAEIANIDYDSIDISEEDEEAYFEVTEYVRLAVLMIHAEIYTEKNAGGDDSAARTIH